MDDGGGFFSAYEAVRLIAALGLHSRRTIRAIGWVDEEGGARGQQHAAIDRGVRPQTCLDEDVAA